MKKGSTTSTVIIIIVILVLGIGAGIYFAKKKSNNSNSNSSNPTNQNTNGQVSGATSDKRELISTPNAEIIIFYGKTCPHCIKVNEYIVANDIDKAVNLQHLEVYTNKANLEQMKQKLEQCKNLSEDDKGGVPFMYAPDTCLVGDQPIIDYLKSKAS